MNSLNRKCVSYDRTDKCCNSITPGTLDISINSMPLKQWFKYPDNIIREEDTREREKSEGRYCQILCSTQTLYHPVMTKAQHKQFNAVFTHPKISMPGRETKA